MFEALVRTIDDCADLVVKKMLESALQLHCRCSEIADIAGAYTLVSANYIRPSLSHMENLALLKGDAYEIKKREFDEWLRSCLDEIPEVTQQTDTNLTPNMRRGVEDLQRRLIESAEMRFADSA